MPKYLVQAFDDPDGAQRIQSASPHRAVIEWVERYRRVPIQLFVKDLDDGQVLKAFVGFKIELVPLTDSASGENESVKTDLSPPANEVSEGSIMKISSAEAEVRSPGRVHYENYDWERVTSDLYGEEKKPERATWENLEPSMRSAWEKAIDRGALTQITLGWQQGRVTDDELRRVLDRYTELNEV